MENLLNAIKELKQAIKDKVVETKNKVNEKLETLATIKQDLKDAYYDMYEINEMANDMSVAMEIVADETESAIFPLEDVLELICPEEFGDEDEDFDDEDEDYIIVEDTETGEETEYPIN